MVLWTVMAMLKFLLSFLGLSIHWAQQFTIGSVIVVHVQSRHVWARPPRRHVPFKLPCNTFYKASLHNSSVFYNPTTMITSSTQFIRNRVPNTADCRAYLVQHVSMCLIHQKYTASDDSPDLDYLTFSSLIFVTLFWSSSIMPGILLYMLPKYYFQCKKFGRLWQKIVYFGLRPWRGTV